MDNFKFKFSIFNRKMFVQLFVNSEDKFDQSCFFVVYCIRLHDVTANTCDIYK